MSYSQTPIGQQLARARESIGLSPDDVLSILRIRHQVLETIEHDQYPEQVIDVFLKGHIVAYCKLVKITPQTILNQLESKGYDFPRPLERTIEEKKSWSIPTYVWAAPVVLLLLSFLFSPSDQPESHHTIAKPYGYESDLELS